VTATQQLVENVPAPAIVEADQHDHEAVFSTDLCPGCGSASLVNTEGCKTCTNCGYSKCS
jgi:ribonucleoside-diphosphate reductase alpha chain